MIGDECEGIPGYSNEVSRDTPYGMVKKDIYYMCLLPISSQARRTARIRIKSSFSTYVYVPASRPSLLSSDNLRALHHPRNHLSRVNLTS